MGRLLDMNCKDWYLSIRDEASSSVCGNKSDSSRSRPVSRDGVNWTWFQRLLESGMNAGGTNYESNRT